MWIRHPSGQYLDCLVTNAEHVRRALSDGWYEILAPVTSRDAAPAHPGEPVAPATVVDGAAAGAGATGALEAARAVCRNCGNSGVDMSGNPCPCKAGRRRVRRS